jgi:hypothetical protein
VFSVLKRKARTNEKEPKARNEQDFGSSARWAVLGSNQ